jgi:hypothetical protein
MGTDIFMENKSFYIKSYIEPIWALGGAKTIYQYNEEQDPKDKVLIDKYKLMFTC